MSVNLERASLTEIQSSLELCDTLQYLETLNNKFQSLQQQSLPNYEELKCISDKIDDLRKTLSERDDYSSKTAYHFSQTSPNSLDPQLLEYLLKA